MEPDNAIDLSQGAFWVGDPGATLEQVYDSGTDLNQIGVSLKDLALKFEDFADSASGFGDAWKWVNEPITVTWTYEDVEFEKRLWTILWGYDRLPKRIRKRAERINKRHAKRRRAEFRQAQREAQGIRA